MASLAAAGPTGPIVRAAYLHRRAGTPAGAAFLTAASERFFDLVLWAFVGAGIVLARPQVLEPLVAEFGAVEVSWHRSLFWIVGGVVVGLAAVGIAVLARPDLPRRFKTHAVPLLDPRVIAPALGWTAAIVVLDVLVLVAASHLIGLSEFAVAPLWTILAASRAFSLLGRLVPWGILGLSLQHGLFIACLAALGADLGEATFLALSLHTADSVAKLAGGLLVGANLTYRGVHSGQS